MAQKTLLAIAILAMAGAANAQTARDEFNSNTDPALVEQLKAIDISTQYKHSSAQVAASSVWARFARN